MPTLLDVQRAMQRSLAEGDSRAGRYIVADGLSAAARLDVYRNTFFVNLTTALRLSYPAVHHIVGADFFESAARRFIAWHIPRSACLDDYGAEFADFLKRFPPATGLAYLPGVARLEWAVNVAHHAPDVDALDLSRLAAAEAVHDGRIALVSHPSVGLVHDARPVDAIWRAVLSRDDAAMAAIDLDAGPVWLLIDRRETGVDVRRVSVAEWRFTSELCAGRPLQAVLASATDVDATMVLAEHLAAGRFIDFRATGSTHAAR